MNKKKLLIFIGIIVIVVSMVFIFAGGIKGNKSNKVLTKAGDSSLSAKLDNILKAANFTYAVTENNGINYGASTRVEYVLNDGTVFEVYSFVENSKPYEVILDTGDMYLLGTNTKYKVTAIKELNIAIKYLNEGSRIKEVKKILK